MFTLTSTSNGRIGEFTFGNKKQTTPSSVIQNSIGGGSGDIFRLICYTDWLPSPMPVLFTYYNLAGFAGSWSNSVKEIGKHDNIGKFILHLRDEFFKKNYFISDYKYTQLDWDPVTILDSGSGNLLTFEIIEKKSNFKETVENFISIIPKYFEFCTKQKFNIMIALDFAEKYTHKDEEKKNLDFDNIVRSITNNFSSNLLLLSKTLYEMQKKDYDFLVYAPIHGNGPNEMVTFAKKILELEKTKKFDGFALGGIAKWSKNDYELWSIPKSSKDIQYGIKLGRAVKIIRKLLDEKNDSRPIHVLGAGGIKNIIPLVIAGADTFDNVTPWRRATDGERKSSSNVFNENIEKGETFSRYLIPLLNDDGTVIQKNNKKVLDYVKLPESILNNVVCNCNVCSKYSMMEIRKLYSGDGENFHYAKILCYVHAKNQFKFICNRLRNDMISGVSSTKLIDEIVDPTLKLNLQTIIRSI